MPIIMRIMIKHSADFGRKKSAKHGTCIYPEMQSRAFFCFYLKVTLPNCEALKLRARWADFQRVEGSGVAAVIIMIDL